LRDLTTKLGFCCSWLYNRTFFEQNSEFRENGDLLY